MGAPCGLEASQSDYRMNKTRLSLHYWVLWWYKYSLSCWFVVSRALEYCVFHLALIICILLSQSAVSKEHNTLTPEVAHTPEVARQFIEAWEEDRALIFLLKIDLLLLILGIARTTSRVSVSYSHYSRYPEGGEEFSTWRAWPTGTLTFLSLKVYYWVCVHDVWAIISRFNWTDPHIMGMVGMTLVKEP